MWCKEFTTLILYFVWYTSRWWWWLGIIKTTGFVQYFLTRKYRKTQYYCLMVSGTTLFVRQYIRGSSSYPHALLIPMTWRVYFVFSYREETVVLSRIVFMLKMVCYQSFDLILSAFYFNAEGFINVSVWLLVKSCTSYADTCQHVFQMPVLVFTIWARWRCLSKELCRPNLTLDFHSYLSFGTIFFSQIFSSSKENILSLQVSE